MFFDLRIKSFALLPNIILFSLLFYIFRKNIKYGFLDAN